MISAATRGLSAAHAGIASDTPAATTINFPSLFMSIAPEARRTRYPPLEGSRFTRPVRHDAMRNWGRGGQVGVYGHESARVTIRPKGRPSV
jgi:hypothetical protein